MSCEAWYRADGTVPIVESYCFYHALDQRFSTGFASGRIFYIGYQVPTQFATNSIYRTKVYWNAFALHCIKMWLSENLYSLDASSAANQSLLTIYSHIYWPLLLPSTTCLDLLQALFCLAAAHFTIKKIRASLCTTFGCRSSLPKPNLFTFLIHKMCVTNYYDGSLK